MPDPAQNPLQEQIIPNPEVATPPEQIELSSLQADELALKEAETSPAIRDEEGNQETVPTEQQVETIEKDPVYEEVEGILEKDLKNIYINLPVDSRPLFKQAGEKIAHTYADSIKLDRLNPDEVMSMTFDWLKTLPDANRGWLEQEAGLKTRKILEYYNVLKSTPQA